MNNLFESLFECIHALLLFMSVETLLDVASMHVDLFDSFSSDRLKFMIDSLIDSVLPVLLFRAKVLFGNEKPEETDENYILGLLIDAFVPRMLEKVLKKITDPDSQIFKLIELLMLLRKNVWVDLWTLLCYSQQDIRKRVANIIFHYFPSLLITGKI